LSQSVECRKEIVVVGARAAVEDNGGCSLADTPLEDADPANIADKGPGCLGW
jgi:hypothetical protein